FRGSSSGSARSPSPSPRDSWSCTAGRPDTTWGRSSNLRTKPGWRVSPRPYSPPSAISPSTPNPSRASLPASLPKPSPARSRPRHKARCSTDSTSRAPASISVRSTAIRSCSIPLRPHTTRRRTRQMASEEMDRLLDNLRRLALRHAAQNLDEHLRQAASLKLGHVAFLARIVEAEVLTRQQTTADKRITGAEFPELCRVEDYDFKAQPCLDRKRVLDRCELGFVDRCEAVLWIGPSGVGKTHLSIALGVRACEAGYRVLFVRASTLLKRLYASLADDTLEEVLTELAQPD